ncbi:MAG: translocation/assembly module TamB domain-containing protein [Deltaproteobacteria bacterium]|nr:translocation/assembly module TamB domain-containing protein [Deltaproteobacteria bacterium]
MTDDREEKTEDREQRTEDGEQKSSRRPPSSVIRHLVKCSLLTLAGFLVLILLLWAGLQTQWAKRQLEGLVAGVTAKTGDYRVAIQGLDGLLPFSITVKEATVSDAKGSWLKLEQFDFSMKPFDLISGLIHVNRLRMDHLTVSRLPESQKNPSKPEEVPTKNTSFALPRILVQEIRLKRIDVGEALAGRPMSFTLNSQLKTGENHIRANASLKDLNRAGDAFELKADYNLKTENLLADVGYHESAGGLVAGLLGLKDLESIQLAATAQGPLSHVKGDLNLRLGGYGKTALQYDVSHEGVVALQLDGQITAETRILPPQVAQLMTSETLDLSLNAFLSPEKEVQLKGLRIKNGSTVISLKGVADLEKEKMDMRADIDGFDPAPFLKGTGVSLQDPGPVHISAVGPFMAPEVTVSTVLAGLNAQGASFNDTTLNVRALFEKNFMGLKSATVALGAQELQIQEAPKLQGPLKVNIEAQSPDFSTWQVKALNMTLPGVVVDVKEALMNLTQERFAGDLTVQVDRIAPLLPPDSPPLDGRFSMNARIKGTGPADLTAQLNMAVSQLSGLPPEAAALAGPKVTLETRAEMKGDRLTLESVALKGSQTEISANGWVDLKESIFDVAYRISLDSSGHGVSKPENLPVGDVRSEGKISGKFDDFSARATLESRSLRVKDLEIKNLKTELKAEGLPKKPSGNVHLSASAMDQPLQLNSDFAWSGKTLTVGDAKVQIPGIDVAASLDLTPETQDFSGKVKGRITSLEMVKALTGVAAKGTGTFQIAAGKTDTQKGASTITLNADFKDLKYQDYGASTLNIRAQVDDIKKMQGSASLNATDMPLGSSHLQTLKLAAKGALSGAEITLETEGTSQVTALAEDQANSGTKSEAPLFLATKIAVKRTDLWQLRLNTLKAGYEGLKVNLQKPATLTYEDDGRINLDDLQLKTDKGLLQADAGMDQDTVEAKVRVTDLPLSLLEPFVGQDLDGSAAISLDLSGPLDDPGVSATVHVDEYKIMGRDGGKPILVNVKLHSKRDGERLVADLELSGLGKTPFKADGSIPAHISLKPFAFDVDKSGKLQGKLQGKFDLAILQSLPAMDDQSLQGKVDIDMGIGGSIEKWELNGGVTISKGRFENVDQGVLLDDIEGRFDAEGRILKLTRLTATDGGTGTISLNGHTDVDPPFQTEMALNLQQATLLRKEMLTVTVGGKLEVKGNKDRMDLTGDINLERTEIAIPKRFPPDVTVIPVTIINDPAATSENSGSKKGTTPLQLNLTVNIPDKFFVRGRGLDAEFKGRLTVTGPADNPVVRGSLNVVRGTFLCLSRTFMVTSGQIAFDGGTPPVPFLNIKTQVNAGEITAQVNVSGPADAFKLKLSSQPSLPQDEIMAQILFGQSVAKLNTFQALQLAYSVNELAGGYGPDVMGKTRGFLGLDRLDFSGGDDNAKSKNDGSNDSTGPSVTLGKYVSDRVYVGVEQDLTDSKQDVIVEINITPNFTVESKAGSRSGAGLGFNWNYDY